MNNPMQLDIACAFANLEDAIDMLGEYWSTQTQLHYVTFNRTDIEKAEEHIYDAMRLIEEYFTPAHLKQVVNGEGH